MSRIKSFDSKCLELAEYFLADQPPEATRPGIEQELAQDIQDAIEMFLEAEVKYKPKPEIEANVR